VSGGQHDAIVVLDPGKCKGSATVDRCARKKLGVPRRRLHFIE
jgi:hypothetical protein